MSVILHFIVQVSIYNKYIKHIIRDCYLSVKNVTLKSIYIWDQTEKEIQNTFK